MASDSSSKPSKKTMLPSSSSSPPSEKSKSRISKTTTIKYKECRRNHAVSMGGYALDGCQEFISGTGGGTKKKTKKADDYLYYCDACGCHRNFHRKEMIRNCVPLGSNGEERHPSAPSASRCLLLMGLGPYQYNLVQPQPPQAAGVNWNGCDQHRVFHGDDDDDDDEELNNNGGMVDDHQVGKKTNPKKKPKIEN